MVTRRILAVCRLVAILLAVSASSHVLADGPAENPAVRKLADGSTKHLLSGLICPAGMHFYISPVSVFCGKLSISPASPPGGDYVSATRFDQAYLIANGADERSLVDGGPFPATLAFGGQQLAVTQIDIAGTHEPGEVADFRVAIGAYTVSAQASGSGATADAAAADLAKDVAAAMADWGTFAAANTAAPQPEPVEPAATAAYLLQYWREKSSGFEQRDMGIADTASGLVCPLFYETSPTPQLGLIDASSDRTCGYVFGSGVAKIMVTERNSGAVPECPIAKDAVAPLVLNGAALPTIERRCTNDKEVKAFRVAEAGAFEIVMITTWLDLSQAPADRQTTAAPYLIDLPNADPATARRWSDALWQALINANR